MIEVCRIFQVNFSQFRVSNFLNFLGEHAPRPPLEDLGPMVKIESIFMRDETPELYKTLIALLEILKTWLLWHFFQSYMLFLGIIENKIEMKLSYMMPAGVCI